MSLNFRPFLAAGIILLSLTPNASPIEAGGPTLHGEVACDLPVSQRKHNIGGSDGAGLCVFTSIMHSARFQNVDQLKDFQAFMSHYPGGGYPEKVDKMIALKCQKENLPQVSYMQYESTDPSLLRKALESGRMPGITYDGRDVHYSGHIEHMVNLVYMDDKYAVILDNNFIGENELVWLTVPEFTSRWIGGRGRQGWAVILLDPGCPPTPPGKVSPLPSPAPDGPAPDPVVMK